MATPVSVTQLNEMLKSAYNQVDPFLQLQGVAQACAAVLSSDDARASVLQAVSNEIVSRGGQPIV